MTWYDPDELKAQADGAQTQPEFDRDVEPDTSEVHDDEALVPFVEAYQAFKQEFDDNYTPPEDNN